MKVSSVLNNINTGFQLSAAKGRKKERPLDKLKTPDEILKYRTKLAVGCVFAVALAADILYFTVKRNLKYDKIENKARLAIKHAESLRKNVPPPDSKFNLL